MASRSLPAMIFWARPASGHEKELRVDFLLEGRAHRATVHDTIRLRWPRRRRLARRAMETCVANNGSAVVKMWSNAGLNCALRTEKFYTRTQRTCRRRKIFPAMRLNFPSNRGAPSSVTLEKLISWTDHAHDGVRYFSGTVAYEKEIKIGAERLNSGRELWLDLGAVKNFAEVSLKRPKPRRALETAVPRERHHRRKTWREHTGRQGHEPLAEPAHRRRTTAAGLRVGRRATQGVATMVARRQAQSTGG